MPYLGKEPARVPVTAADIPDDSITAAKIVDGVITAADIGPNAVNTSELVDDAVTADKLANSINTAIAANTAKTGITTSQTNAITANTAKVTNATHTGDVTGATALTITDDAVTAAKLANSINTDIATGVTANTTANAALPKSGGAMTGAITTNSTFDGRDVSTDGTKLDGIAASANNYVHPNHSGEVTSSADGATVIADNMVDEANLKISNTPTNGYVLTAQSGNTGGMTWAEMTGGGPSLGTDSIIRTNAQTISEDITIGSTTNGMSAGPITIADGYTVTVNGNWSVV